jgi:hypothetical protein
LFEQLGGELGEHAHYPQTEREEAYFPAISETAARLLKRLPPEPVPRVAIDAVLRIGNRVERGREVRASLSAAQAELHRTVSRRRAAFWRVAERLRRPAEKGRNIEHPYQMQTLGYHPGLQGEDVTWLTGSWRRRVPRHTALLRLQKEVTCPIPAPRLQVFAEERAINDSESAPWPPNEVLAFEQHHEVAPRTAKDLRTVLVHRVEDMKHDLLHGDFSQGRMVKALRKEVDVQNWIAERLQMKQGRSFSVERECHVADEKEPDIRVRGVATEAAVAMEIKVAETWTLTHNWTTLSKSNCAASI